MARGTIREERPDLLEYLVNEEDGELTCGREIRIQTKCPDCNFVKEMSLTILIKNGFYCNECNKPKTIEEDYPELVNWLVNKNDKDLSCTSKNKIKVKCPICGNIKSIIVINACRLKRINCSNYGCENNQRMGVKTKYLYNVGEIIRKTILILEQTTVVYNDKNKKRGISNRKAYLCKCLIDNYEFTITETDLKTRQGCIKCYERNLKDIALNRTEYKYKNGDIINKDILILEQTVIEYKDARRKAYKCKCLIDEQKWICLEKTLARGIGCPFCSGREVIVGKTDIATTNPEMVKYFVNSEDTYKYSYGSGRKVLMKCQDCGFTKKVKISDLYNRGFCCDKCNDYISYPEKFMRSLLKLLNVKFKTEYSPNWANNKRYDFYLSKYKTIIETHGNQHYERGFSGRTLEEEQENDKLKKELALKYGIKHYIVLDCRKSEMEWIKNSIFNSELPTILKFLENDIDWKQVELDANNSLLIKVCKEWNEKSNMTVKILSEKYNISGCTITKWLNTGTKLGLCDYDGKEIMKLVGRKNGKAGKGLYGKMVICNNIIYNTITECSNHYSISNARMGGWLNNKYKTPQEYIDLGLRYATEEDLNTYESYKELN